MKFIWYIIDLEDGEVKGTNDTDALLESGILDSDMHIVLHQEGEYFLGDPQEKMAVTKMKFQGQESNDEDEE